MTMNRAAMNIHGQGFEYLLLALGSVFLAMGLMGLVITLKSHQTPFHSSGTIFVYKPVHEGSSFSMPFQHLLFPLFSGGILMG